jgi:hypothetical protein
MRGNSSRCLFGSGDGDPWKSTWLGVGGKGGRDWLTTDEDQYEMFLLSTSVELLRTSFPYLLATSLRCK